MNMMHLLCPVEGVQAVAEETFLLTFISREISVAVQPGQFVNIRVSEQCVPLLRRPFSVHRVNGDRVEVVFNVVGRGTELLRRKRPAELLDVLGPLGVPFRYRGGDFSTAILVAGGLGVAPLPLLTAALRAEEKTVMTFLGARTGGRLVERHLENLRVATDDGSSGVRGTVVDLVRAHLADREVGGVKMFGCGPTAMLKALASFARQSGIPCEVSLEGQMGCGFGICQGCPVELEGEERSYALMCKEGPVFDVSKIRM